MVRRLERSDYDAWLPLWQAYLSFYRAELPPETTASTFERLVGGDLVGLVAEDGDGALVGFVHLVLHGSTWSVEPCSYLEDLFVAPTARGTSTAADLFAAAYAESDRCGAAKTYWQTQEYNGAARSLYDQVGRLTSFVVYER